MVGLSACSDVVPLFSFMTRFVAVAVYSTWGRNLLTEGLVCRWSGLCLCQYWQINFVSLVIIYIYRVSQNEWTKLREGVPYVKVYRYNPKHLCPKLVTEIKAREKCCLLAVPRIVPGSCDVIPIRCALSVFVYSRLKRVPCCECTCKVLGNHKENYDMSASVFVVQFNGFMSLTS